MQIVDAQVHIWRAKRTQDAGATVPSQPLKPPFPKNVDFSKDDLLREMDEAGVHRAVIVTHSEGQTNDLPLEAARLHPDRLRVMGHLDLQSPQSRGQLKSWREQPGMLGLRINFRKIGRKRLADGALDWAFAEAEQAKVPIMFLSTHADLDLWYDVGKRHPQLRLALDHLGLARAGGKDQDAFRRFDQVLRLAELPNMAVKVSALPLFTDDAYPYRAFHPYLRQTYDAFGPKRMFWGSDMTRLPCPYRQVVTMFTEEMPWLSSEDKEWIMGRALCAWSGWE